MFKIVLREAITQLKQDGKVSLDVDCNAIPNLQANSQTKAQHLGDLTSLIAFQIAYLTPPQSPHTLAEAIVSAMNPHPRLEKVEAHRGFINFFIKKSALYGIIPEIISKKNGPIRVVKGGSNSQVWSTIQYAYARVHGCLRQCQCQGIVIHETIGSLYANRLDTLIEIELLVRLSSFYDIEQQTIVTNNPQDMLYYLEELAKSLHSYYNATVILCEDVQQQQARLCLLVLVRKILKNGMQLIDIPVLESM